MAVQNPVGRNARVVVLFLAGLAVAGVIVSRLRHDDVRLTLPAAIDPQNLALNDAFPVDARRLESYRSSGDLQQQRAHLWRLFASLIRTDPVSHEPVFIGWFNEAQVFERSDPPVDGQRVPVAGPRVPFPGLPIGARLDVAMRSPHLADAAVMTFVHYNLAAYRHVRRNRLYLDEQLQDLNRAGQPDPEIHGMRTIPAFPRDAIVVMTAWWPISAQGVTPMPVWDADVTSRAFGSNNYVSWSRAVAIDPAPVRGSGAGEIAVEFAGNFFPAARRIGLEHFYHIAVDAQMAARLMQDRGAKKAAIIALGRPLQAGDQLALVGIHVLATELKSGIWGTFWWHDRAQDGPFASGRPDDISGVWSNYLMDVAFDAVLPRGEDGTPRICFNPWFDANFPDGGYGNGLHSNCVNCHDRASYPATDFLPVRRGPPDLQGDPAFAAGRLRTAQLWSLANLGRTAAPGALPRSESEPPSVP